MKENLLDLKVSRCRVKLNLCIFIMSYTLFINNKLALFNLKRLDSNFISSKLSNSKSSLTKLSSKYFYHFEYRVCSILENYYVAFRTIETSMVPETPVYNSIRSVCNTDFYG